MRGKISAGIFKAMAVVSALSIGGGYVAWRQAEARKDMAEQTDAEANRERERLLREMDEVWQADVKQLELMPGSKNPVRKPLTRVEIEEYLEKGRNFIHPIPGIPEGAEEVSNVTPLLPGSKSISMPLFTKEQLEEMSDSEKEGKLPELLPGSKVGILRLPTKESEPPVQIRPKLLPGSKSGALDLIPNEPDKSE